MNKKSSRAKKIAPSHHNCSSSGSPVQPAWTPFEKGVLPPLPEVSVMQEQADSAGVTLEEVISTYESIAREESVLINSRYQVNIRKIGDAMVHLSIKRRDKAPVHDWRDLQRIKNEVVGPENEAVEIYPAESRLVDSANQYHLFVFTNPAYRVPFGFSTRMVTAKPGGNAVQRPFEV